MTRYDGIVTWFMKESSERRRQRSDAPALNEGADAAEWVRERLELAVDSLHEPARPTTNKPAKAVHQAYHTAESLTVVVSPSGRQSGEFLRKATKFARMLGIRPKGDGDNEISLELPNGSRIVGLPGTEATIRGFSAVSLLLVDEAARCSDELYLAIRPMLAVSDGTLWLMSTPFGKRGFFYETWANGGPEWERFRAPATECARTAKGHLDEERATMGERWFRQEYLCEFEDTVSGIFARELVESAITDEIKPLVIG